MSPSYDPHTNTSTGKGSCLHVCSGQLYDAIIVIVSVVNTSANPTNMNDCTFELSYH